MTWNYTRKSKHLKDKNIKLFINQTKSLPVTQHTLAASLYFNQPSNVQMCCVTPNDQTKHTDDKKQLNTEVAKDLKRKQFAFG